MTRPEDALNERAQHLLKALVERYIRDGQPVGSRILARDSRLDLSSASVRNVMADLEDLGFVCSPHTSAGRVPTIKGYRFFVDTLLTVKPLRSREVARMRQSIERPVTDSRALIQAASATLSGLTHMAGVVSAPRRDHTELRHIEFLAMSEQRVLAVMVFSDNEVQNRVLPVDRPYNASELQEASNFLNAKLAGQDLHRVRADLLSELKSTERTMTEAMRRAVTLAEHALEEPATDDAEAMFVAGQTNLMDFAELSDVPKLRGLFEAFNTKRDLLHLLDRCVSADGVQIFIGEESGYRVLDECSVVTAPYSVDDEVVGVLGVIGPTRMAYERVIPIVDVTAKLLGAALNSKR
jgi:heat-inducible transcriptional repressor